MSGKRGAWLLICAVLVAGCSADGDDLRERQQDVAEAGAQVMPFDLDRTTHRFETRTWGGIQTVTADDASDETQVGLVREHLEDEATAFRRGDFGDPLAVHGGAMPGVSTLVAEHESLTIVVEPVEAGARIVFRSSDPDVVAALHAWFDAQVADHGEHAEAVAQP